MIFGGMFHMSPEQYFRTITVLCRGTFLNNRFCKPWYKIIKHFSFPVARSVADPFLNLFVFIYCVIIEVPSSLILMKILALEIVRYVLWNVFRHILMLDLTDTFIVEIILYSLCSSTLLGDTGFWTLCSLWSTSRQGLSTLSVKLFFVHE